MLGGLHRGTQRANWKESEVHSGLLHQRPPRRWLIVLVAVSLTAAIVVGVLMVSRASRATADTTAPSCDSGTTVNTGSGPVCGFVSSGVTQWLGIPYAAPPLGQLRWQPPQAPTPWTAPLPALQYSAGCPGAGVPVTSEDCLYLNVIAPPNPSGQHLPVMVWIHGGGFQFGASSEFPGVNIASSGHVVFVSMNYRLGLLGFLATHAFGAHAGDYGLEDQQAALRWVRDNISAFGGDPHQVTIFGESAGGSSVCDQLASPDAAGLFGKAISESGFYNSITGVNTSFQPQDCKSTLPTEEQAASAGDAFAARVGCTNPAEEADCLRNTPLATLRANSGGLTGATNSPIVNGTTLTMSPAVAFARGRFNRVSTIMGTLRDEDLLGSPTTTDQFTTDVQAQYGAFAARVLAAYPLDRYATPYIDFRTMMADANTICPALRTEGTLSRWVQVHGYEIDDTDASSGGGGSLPQGAFHGAELRLLFPTLIAAGTTLDANQQALANQMTSEWTSFAVTGNPTATGTPVWPEFDHKDGTVMSLQPAGDSQLTDAAQLSTVHNCRLWNSLPHQGD